MQDTLDIGDKKRIRDSWENLRYWTANGTEGMSPYVAYQVGKATGKILSEVDQFGTDLVRGCLSKQYHHDFTAWLEIGYVDQSRAASRAS